METWTWRHGHGNMDMETWRHGHGEMDTDMETWRHGDMDIEKKEKRKPWRFSLTRLSFAHCANGGFKFDRLLTQKQTDVIRLQTD
jgi:hypothetical protein